MFSTLSSSDSLTNNFNTSIMENSAIVQIAGALVSLVASLFVGLKAFRKFDAKISSDVASCEATAAGAGVTTAMMINFHNEINRLAMSNEMLATENAALRKQLARVEGMLEKMAMRFGVDVSEFHKDAQQPIKG